MLKVKNPWVGPAHAPCRAPPHKNPYLVKLTHIDMACTTVVAASFANAW